ncbi:hypothetical protein SELMODRAFT_97942 [Selaginella moellendorffii]|uniref:Pentacotripeptide-repeat region of PRORP domain-containing protein n=1 Tax=Selaginella moellendorffii TaxID=88036 RepID=D8RNS8_SELML|nr:hypothetical protein SELMODRAFT_97942 [Selaginella moellendorffii]
MPQKSTVSWNSLIGAFSRSGRPIESLVLFWTMNLEGVRPNSVTFMAAIEACTSMEEISHGRFVHAVVLSCEGEASVGVMNALINMYGKHSRVSEARKTFASICKSHRDVISWNSMISAYARNGRLQEAKNTFHKMAMDGVLPNEVTFLALLSALGHSGDVKRGWSFFISMHHDYGLVWGIDHLVCTVDLFGRAGLIEQAERIVLSSSFARLPVPWMALLSACKSSRNPGTIEKSGTVARTALELNTAKSSPYVLVSNAFLDDLPYFPGARTLPYQPPPPAAPLVKTHLG